MHIWHAGAGSPRLLNGVNATVWLLAREQARLGHRVGVLMDASPDEAALKIASDCGLELLELSDGTWGYQKEELARRLADDPPRVVHMHSVFIPKQAMLARELIRRRIPYLVTPHGGFAPVILSRGWLKKFFYKHLLERSRCRSAAMMVAAPGEEQDLRAFTGDDSQQIRTIPIPIDSEAMSGAAWKADIAARKFVFLGRFDVHVKGIDTLVEVAKLMPESRFELYGSDDPKTIHRLRQIQANCPPNVAFFGPAFDLKKRQVLCDASVYLQLSRSESFGISIAEAMYLGVPCAITQTMKMASVFQKHDLGMILPPDAPGIVRMLQECLASPGMLQHWSQRCRDYAASTYDPGGCARRYLQLYDQVSAAPAEERLSTLDEADIESEIRTGLN